MARQKTDDWLVISGGTLEVAARGAKGRIKVVSRKSYWSPSVDLIEFQDKFVLKAELAGVESGDFEVFYVPGKHSILLRGFRAEQDPCEDCRTNIHLLEVYYGEFEREIELPPTPISAERIESIYKDGMLNVYIPKAKRKLTHARITIRKV
ncbi:MAG: Hsp20/alpha crystallin family protein [Fimbriimonadaceae bacterium]|nr:Hsp20/alpha crystallin family protein [Fimbriimonadaceae bacterium]QOJ10517.1 MAG: Hsp20/alpha crystallin family protein [Chthonomonadaceae bacterium]